ncbi:hypothetical protein CsSME_00019689 [Camellia sinensis var. sinensis]
MNELYGFAGTSLLNYHCCISWLELKPQGLCLPTFERIYHLWYLRERERERGGGTCR